MPILKPKQVQKGIEENKLYPVYWLYGPESMKMRELIRRFRFALFGDEKANQAQLQEHRFHGSDCSASEIIDRANTVSLMGGCQLILIQDAHLLKKSDDLLELFSPPKKKEELNSVCIFISKDLDKRKKLSKAIIKESAAVPCDEVPDRDREAWVHYLAKKKNLKLDQDIVLRLRSMDPWSLDLLNQELEKYSINPSNEILPGATSGKFTPDDFLESFFTKSSGNALEYVSYFANKPEETIPLLGLLAWNLRQFAAYLFESQSGIVHQRLNPYLLERFERWKKSWTLEELRATQHKVAELDFAIKQLPKSPLGLWSDLIFSSYSQEI